MINYFECDCGSKEHTFCVTTQDWEDYLPPQLYFHFQLSQPSTFIGRCWKGIKYIFGYKCKYGHWDTINLSEEDLNRLTILLHQHRARLSKYFSNNK